MKKLMKELFTRANLETNIYITFILGSLIFLSLTSCSTIEPLEGLCYNDRDGTYLCPKKDECDTDMDSSADNMCLDSVPEEKEPDMEELQPLYDYCEQFQYHGGEVWMQCIMNEDARRKLLIERLA